MLTLALPKRPSLTLVSGVALACYAAAYIHNAWALALYVVLVLSFAYGYLMPSLRLTFLVYIGFCLVNVLGQLWAFASLPTGGLDLSWGVFGNPNYLGCALAFGLASSLAFRFHVAIPPLAGGLWLTQSRSALLGASAALFIALWRHSRFWALVVVNLGILTAVLSSHGEALGVWQRLGIWQDTFNHLTFLGQGWGSYADAYASWSRHTNMTLILTNHAYNDYLELVFELGIGAVALWVFVISILSGTKSELKLVVAAYGVMALTYFPLWVLPIGPLLAATLGHLARRDA